MRTVRATPPPKPPPPAGPVSITAAHPAALDAARALLRPGQRLHIGRDGSLLLLNVTAAPTPWTRAAP